LLSGHTHSHAPIQAPLLNIIILKTAFNAYTFNALTLLVGRQEEHGYVSGVMCRLFAYSPADATAIAKPHHLLPHYLNPDWFYLSGTSLPRGHLTGAVVVVVILAN